MDKYNFKQDTKIYIVIFNI